MPAPRKRKSVVEDALASPPQPGTVSEDSSDEQRRQRRHNVAANRPGMAAVVNRQYALWREVNLETQLEALNRETLRVVSEWTFEPLSSSNAGGGAGGRSLDVAEYTRAAKDIESRYGGPSGSIVTYGNNESSQLGIPELLNEKIKFVYPPRRVNGVVAPARHVACGGLHNVVLLENGNVMTWGCSDGGPLGRPAEADDSEPTPTLVQGFTSKGGLKEDGQVISVAAGDSHTLYLTQNGNVYMTGMYKDADSGQFHDVRSPQESPEGSNLTPVHVSLLPQNVMQIYARGGYNAAMLSDRSIVTWGFGNCGELARTADMGNIDRDKDGVFDMKKPHIKNSIYDLDFVRNQFLKPSPVRFAAGNPKKTVLNVACGSFHLLVVAREPHQFQSTLYSSGLNQYGQLGLGDGPARHELTPVTALKHIDVGQVAAGMHHSMCLNLSGSQVYSWGRKDYGQLGHGGAKAAAGAFSSTPTLVQFSALEGPKVHLFTDIACGDHTSMALTVDHDLYTWGYEGTTGHGKFNGKDLTLPMKLNVNDSLKKLDNTSTAVVYKISCGGQHSALLVKRFADSSN